MLIRALNGDRPKTQIKIKATNTDDRLKKWQEYFKNLLNNEESTAEGIENEDVEEDIEVNENIYDGQFTNKSTKML